MVTAAGGVVACDSSRSSPPRDGGVDAKRIDGGSLQISATNNRCPTVSAGASPPEAQVGERINVSGAVTDADTPASALAFTWTAGAGTFINPAAAVTAYNCLTSGPQTLTLAVSDGQCSTSRSIAVFCFPPRGGSGGAVAGTGGRGGSGGSTGSGGLRASGGAGMVGPGASGGSGPSGGGGVVGTGGSTSGSGGATGSGGVTGSGGTTGSGGGVAGVCSGDPTADEGDACNDCTADNCVPETDGCAMLDSDAKRQRCWKLYCCLRASRCADGDPLQCWCGSAPTTSACFTVDSAGDGPCLREFQEAADSVRAADIKQRLVDPAVPVGAAVNLALLRRNYCSPYAEPPSNACRL